MSQETNMAEVTTHVFEVEDGWQWFTQGPKVTQGGVEPMEAEARAAANAARSAVKPDPDSPA
jgi:hypothetical protein